MKLFSSSLGAGVSLTNGESGFSVAGRDMHWFKECLLPEIDVLESALC
jgi:hypothetical protein